MAGISEALALAIQRHQDGQLQAAEQIYRQILAVEPNQPDALHLLGVIASQAGKPDSAIEFIERALQFRPDYAQAHSNLGLVLKYQGRVDEAVACYRRALALKPDFAEAHYYLGLALGDQGRREEAAACYRQALAWKPDFAEAHNDLGNAFKEGGDLEEAVACYQRALALKPEYAEAHNNLGVVLKDQGNVDEAVACYRRALALKPDFAEAHINLGLVLSDQGNLDEAVVWYRRALDLKPDFAEAHNNLGLALKYQGNLDEAAACCRRALRLKPDYAEAHNNLGIALAAQGKLDEAVACYEQALRLKRDCAEAYSNLGFALKEQGKWQEAGACYRQALALKPDSAEARFNQSLWMLVTGDFERGWAQYEWRWKTKQYHIELQRCRISQPLWDGQTLAGRTILLHEQGLGDTLQFVRYAPLVKELVGTVLLECRPELRRILQSCAGIDRILSAGNPLPGVDVQAPLMSLPAILKTTLATVPVSIPYLRADPSLVWRWREQLSKYPGLKIGIVWQGDPRLSEPGWRAADQRRSIPLACFESLAGVPGVQLFSLQKGYGTDQIIECQARWGIIALGDQLNDFMDTAALMMNLDLIISVDTAPVHLAGALGRPVWTLVPFAGCWRWLLDRTDSPWYPTMRLFRQRRPGDWSEVFERIATAVQKSETVLRATT